MVPNVYAFNMREFFKSFVYAVHGIRASLWDQRNLKVQFIIAIITILAGFYFGITATEWGLILLSIAAVMGLEMINTALESLVDLVTTERKPLAGKVKDVAAGAVLFASVIAVVIGVIVFRKYLM